LWLHEPELPLGMSVIVVNASTPLGPGEVCMLMATAADFVRHFALWSGLVWSSQICGEISMQRLLHGRSRRLIKHRAAHRLFLQDSMFTT
jgi:hypothetical protein